MNADVMYRQWNQMRTEAQRRWNKLTDEDLDSARGHADRLAGLIEERYGYGRRMAEEQVKRFMNQYGYNSPGELANGLLADLQNFVNTNPWIAMVALMLILGLVRSLLGRPRSPRSRRF